MEKEYIGNELELFEKAYRWKNYFKRVISPFICGNVLEVGAGIGGTTSLLVTDRAYSWLCLEPDPGLAKIMEKKKAQGIIPSICKIQAGTINNLPVACSFDTIIYIDVLEHIEKDREELENASRILTQGGHLVVLCPAHNWLYSPFDKAIGHFRRYNKKMFNDLAVDALDLVQVQYLDSAGLLTSSANKFFLKQSYPTLSQVKFWDNYIVPLSEIMDSALGYKFGKSIIGIWKKR